MLTPEIEEKSYSAAAFGVDSNLTTQQLPTAMFCYHQTLFTDMYIDKQQLSVLLLYESNTCFGLQNIKLYRHYGYNDIGIGVLGIAQYFPVLVILGIGQYFYWLSYPIPILLGHLDTSCQQMSAGKLGRRKSKARVLANEGTQNEIQQTVIFAFITHMVILIAIVWIS